MSRITTKINLAGLNHARKMMKGQNGEIECLVIPINANKLFVGEKGVYLDLIGFEMKEPQKNEKGNIVATHVVKQSFSKEHLDSLTQEQKDAIPLLGANCVLEFTSSEIGGSEIAPLTDEDTDLPF
jgi:hypothetical protein